MVSGGRRPCRARLDEAEARLADVDARVADLLEPILDRIHRADRRIAELERSRAELERSRAELDARVDTLDQRSAGLISWHDSISQRATTTERAVEEQRASIESLSRQVEGVSAEQLRAVEEQLTATVGEATIARIELERLGGSIGQRFDTLQVRVADVESQLAEQADVSAAVQLERLDELERAVVELDPDSLMRKV